MGSSNDLRWKYSPIRLDKTYIGKGIANAGI